MSEKTGSERIKILVVGGGAREHALAWKLAQSPLAAEVHAAPGNAGMTTIAKIAPIGVDEYDRLTAYAKEEGMSLAVIGPEAPLAAGLADKMEAAGLKVFGPRAAAARLESSKAFSKDFMFRHGIPTAAARVFTSSAEALAYLEGRPEGPIVVKASGLAAGKGVIVAADRREAAEAARSILDEGLFGEAGRELVIEDFIDGEEFTLLSFTDGRDIKTMPATQDHKRLGEGDVGPNTGGLGAYAPVSIYTPETAALVEERVIRPTLAGLKADGLDFRGCLYFGLIMPAPGSPYQGPQVLEYNARFGDPETQALMPLLKSDLAEIMLLCAEGRLAEAKVEWRNESCACVVIASGGYPGEYASGLPVTESVTATRGVSLAFHGGTALNDRGEIITAGGRVITVAARDLTLEKALAKAYERVQAIHFQNSYYRRDIGRRELARRIK